MECEKQWRPLNDTSIPVFGSSSSSLNESVFLIGGLTTGNKTPQTVLQIRNFDVNVMNWSPVQVNANDILNRAYHASTTLGDSVYIFGGAAASLIGGHEVLLDEVVKCTMDSFEGLKCVSSHSANAQLKGHSASTMGGGDLVQKIVLFGGSTVEGTCDSSDILVYVGDDEENMVEGEVLKRVSCTGPAPPPRSNHAVAVAGGRLEYLVVTGGWDGAEAYDDLWICDMTNLLSGRPLEPEEVIPVKGQKKKDEAPLPQLFTWHQVNLTEPMDGRFMHGCWAVCRESLIEGITVTVFGGMTAFGPVAPESMLQYAVEFDGKVCSASLEGAPQAGQEGGEGAGGRFGFSYQVVSESGSPALMLVFGGRSEDCPSECCVLNERAAIAGHLAACVPLPDLVGDEEEDSTVKVIQYPNGDLYEGEIFTDIDEDQLEESKSKSKEGGEEDPTALIRHGYGVMKYADGGVYEGEWEYNQQHGGGKYITFDQQTVYDGNFVENEFSGTGQLSLNSGSRIYNGNFEQGQFQGTGTLLDNEGKTLYTGDFSGGMKHGSGTLREVNDSSEASGEPGPLIYAGEWREDKPAGQGTLVLPGGHVYTGDIGGKSVPEGQGECKYADGGEYCGSWRSGKRNGTGVYTGRALDEYTGKWVGDVRSGRGLWVSKRGDSYEGLWDANFPHGQGTMTYNAREAEDQDQSSRERTYRGEWSHGKRNGYGEVVYLDGSVKKGTWKTNRCDEALADYDAGQ